MSYDRQKELIRNNPKRYLLNTARRRSRKKGLEFTIGPDDFNIPEYCPVLGIPLTVLNSRVPGPNSTTIDRKDNSKGYVPGNVTVISYRANTLKKDAEVEELEAIVRYMKEYTI